MNKPLTLKAAGKYLGILLIVVGAVYGFRLLSLLRDVDQYRKYWQERRGEKPATNALTYIALGDSAAQGIGASSPKAGYVGLIEAALEEAYGRPVHVLNFSASGSTTGHVLNEQLPEMIKVEGYTDAVITLAIGANNLPQFKEGEFRNEVDQIFEQLPKQAVVADIPYFGGGRMKALQPVAKRASEIVRQTAAKHGLRLAPLQEVTKQQGGPSTYAADFFHPNNKGYRNWFEAFWPILKS